MFPSFSSYFGYKNEPPIIEEKEDKAMTLYQQQQATKAPFGYFNQATQSWNFLTNWWEEYRNSKPLPTTNSIFSNSKRIDPNILENAYKILGITESDAENISLIKTRYETITNSLKERQARLSGPLATQIQFLIDDAEAAYKTLTNNL